MIDKGKVYKEATVVHCMVVKDLFTGEKSRYRGDTLPSGVDRLWAAELILGHNITQYDCMILERIYKRKRPKTCKIDDSMIRLRVMYPEHGSSPGGGNSLDEMGTYLGKPKTKFDGPWDRWSQVMEDYCSDDVDVQEAIDEWLQKQPQNDLIYRIEQYITELIARQTANGWTFDIPAGEKLVHELDLERVVLHDKLQALFPPTVEVMKTPAYYVAVNSLGKELHREVRKGQLQDWIRRVVPKDKRKIVQIKPGPMAEKLHPFNPDSPHQVGQRLIEKYGWKPTAFTDGKEPIPKTDYDTLVTLDYPGAKVLLDYAEVAKLMDMVSDYLERAKLSRDGKIHGTINVQGCVTGRMSHNQPNMGNVPKVEKDKSGNYIGRSYKIRPLFKPRPGWWEVGGDASGLELRMLGNRMHRWDGGAYAKVILEGDIHTENQKILATAVPDITRNNSKTFIYGFLYGAGDAKAGRVVKKGADVGKRMKEAFFKKLPALKKVIDWVHESAKKGGLQLLDTRVVPIRSMHAALNTLLQGDGACVMKTALILLDKKLQADDLVEDKDYAYLGNIHDEFQMEARTKELADQVGKTMVWAIKEAGRRLGCKVPLDGEYKVGASWAETH